MRKLIANLIQVVGVGLLASGLVLTFALGIALILVGVLVVVIGTVVELRPHEPKIKDVDDGPGTSD